MTDTMAGEDDLVGWFSQYIDRYVEEQNGPDTDALIACLDRVRDSYRLAAQPSAGAQGEVETMRLLLDNLVISQSLSKALREKATDDARSYLYDLRQKPSGHTSKCWGRTSYSDEVAHCYCATPSQPDTGDVAALREALTKWAGDLNGRFVSEPYGLISDGDIKALSNRLAALSKPLSGDVAALERMAKAAHDAKKFPETDGRVAWCDLAQFQRDDRINQQRAALAALSTANTQGGAG